MIILEKNLLSLYISNTHKITKLEDSVNSWNNCCGYTMTDR